MGNGLGFYIGTFFVAYYGLMIVIGSALAAALGWYQVRRFHKSYDDFILLAAITGLCGIIGAKLLYLLISLEQIDDIERILDPRYWNELMSGGFVFYGGVIGGALGLSLCRALLKLDVRSLAAATIPCLPTVHAFGRIGCCLVGCCYGKPYGGWGSITYESSFFAPNHVPLFPVQLVEAVCNLSIAAVLLVCINRHSYTRGVKLYLIMYSSMRFVLELFRYDYRERGIFLWLSTSQYISLIILLLIGICHIIEKRHGQPCA